MKTEEHRLHGFEGLHGFSFLFLCNPVNLGNL